MGVCAITFITLLVAASQLVSEYEKRQADQRLSAAREGFDRLLNNREDFIHSQLRIITGLPVFRALLTDPSARTDRPTMNQLTEYYRSQMNAEQCVIFDDNGNQLGFAAKEGFSGSILNAEQLTKEPRSSIVESNGVLYLVVSEPAMFLTETLGRFGAAYRLDDKVAAELAALTQTEVTFFASARVAASSLSPADRSRIEALPGDGYASGTGNYFLADRYIGGRYPFVNAIGSQTSSLLLMVDRRPTELLLASIRVRML
jgi:hypothetical protein